MFFSLFIIIKLFANADGGIWGTCANNEQSNGQQKENEAAFSTLQLTGEVDQILFHGLAPY
jgi:hypothetical protein